MEKPLVHNSYGFYYRYKLMGREMVNMEKFKCKVCGTEKKVAKKDDGLFHHPVCCGQKMYIAS